MEVIEVIDTAVKVGLGALISGLTTYAVTARNHRSDNFKEKAKRKVEILTFAIDKFDIYINCVGECLSLINGWHRQGRTAGPLTQSHLDAFTILDKKLIASRTEKAIAQSRLHLIGLTEANDIIKSLAQLEKEFRLDIVFNHNVKSKEDMDEIVKKISQERTKMYDLVAREFNDIYK